MTEFTQADIDTMDRAVQIALTDFQKLFSTEEIAELRTALEAQIRDEYNPSQVGGIIFLDVPDEWMERLEERKSAALTASIAASSDRGNEQAIFANLTIRSRAAYTHGATESQCRHLARLLAARGEGSEDAFGSYGRLTKGAASRVIDQLKSSR